VSPSGSIKWIQSFGNCYSTPTISSDGSTIYYGTTNYQEYAVLALYTTGSLKWAISLDDIVESSPALGSNGIIYVGSTNYNFYAIYPSGTIKWSYYMYSGVTSSAAIGNNGTIYVGTNGGVLYALTSSAELLWATQTPGQFYSTSPSIGPDGSIYIGSSFDDHSLYAFSITGSIKWVFVSDGIIYSTPSITPNNEIVFNGYSDDYVYCLTSYGSLIWRFATYSYSGSSPTIGSNGIIYVGADSLYAIYPFGSLQWKTLINLYPQTPIISRDGIIYVAAGFTVYTVGTLLSTLSPSTLPYRGLELKSSCPKFQNGLKNSVIFFCILICPRLIIISSYRVFHNILEL
jgi:hypothetical protein